MEFKVLKILLSISDRRGDRPWDGRLRKLFETFSVGFRRGVVVLLTYS